MGDIQALSGQLLPANPTVPSTAAGALESAPRSYVDQHSAFNPLSPLSRWGLITATGYPLALSATGSYGPNSYSFARMFIPAGQAITGCICNVRTAGAGAAGTGQNGFAFYELSGTTGTLVTSTATDATIWTSTGGKKKAFGSVVAAQANDREVMIGMGISIATTAPQLSVVSNWAFLNTHVVSAAQIVYGTYTNSALTSWPASQAMAGLGGDIIIPFLALY